MNYLLVMRITQAQLSFLDRLLIEAEGKMYSARWGYVARNRAHTMDKADATALISELVEAKKRGWTSWESTESGQAELASKAKRTEIARERGAVLLSLKAEGFFCNCSAQELEVDKADPALCPLHSRFDIWLSQNPHLKNPFGK